jgi:methane/ammonia monooxygenase subunit C
MDALNATSAASVSNRDLGPKRFVNLVPLAIGMVLLVALYGGARTYQQLFSWSMGTDSTSPEFDRYWMTLLYGELIVAAILGPCIWLYVWLTRDRHLDQLGPHQELRRYFTLTGLLTCYVFAVYATASFFGEADGAWHQVVVRDTSFTASHIILFYLTIPVYIICGFTSYLYAMTRLPQFARGLSLAFTTGVAGPFLILPNLGYNEWGHLFWMTEEFFGAPLHWGFVVLGWSALGLVGTLLQVVHRMVELFRVIYSVPVSTSMPMAPAAE